MPRKSREGWLESPWVAIALARALAAVEAEDRGAILERLLALSDQVDRFAKIASARYATLVDERPERTVIRSEPAERAQTVERAVELT